MNDKRELTHADMKMLAAAVVTVWPELKERNSTELIEGWRALLSEYKIEIGERKQKRVRHG